jgi:hypothetical protein
MFEDVSSVEQHPSLSFDKIVVGEVYELQEDNCINDYSEL